MYRVVIPDKRIRIIPVKIKADAGSGFVSDGNPVVCIFRAVGISSASIVLQDQRTEKKKKNYFDC